MTQDDVLLAGELALGVLEGEERGAAMRRQLADPLFAAEVTRWRERLGGLHGQWPEAQAPIATPRIGGEGASTRAVGRWRGAAVTAAVAAAAMLALLVMRPVPKLAPASTAAPALVAALTRAGARPTSAIYDGRSGTVTLIGAPDVPAGHSAELWAIGSGAAPRAVGLIVAGARSRVVVAPALRPLFIAGTTLAVSQEPAGGSPGSLPTGPVVASGGLARL